MRGCPQRSSARPDASHAGWRRVRSGLVALLGFLDDEPGGARLLLFAASIEPTAAFRYEQRVLGVLAGLLDDGSPPAIAQLTVAPALSAQLIRGGVLSVIRARMSDPEAMVGRWWSWRRR